MLTHPLSASPAATPSTDAARQLSPLLPGVLRQGAWFALPQLGLLEVSGADAASFLHNLLTNDIQNLDAEHARLAGFCTPKGRLLASFLVWRNPQAIHLLLSADILAAIQKRLSMFVLRAKAKLSDASPNTLLIGLSGEPPKLLGELFGGLPSAPYNVLHSATGEATSTLLRLPDAAGVARYLWAVPRSGFEATLSAMQESLAEGPAEQWDWLAIQAGEPRISAATQEKFVPQMINFEAIGGVNFKKGCYPGQEIVARSQYLGTVKRRAALAHLAQTAYVAAGQEVFHSDDPNQPCGTVINAAAAPEGGQDCLVELKLSALASGSVHLGSVNGALLTFRSLPYALPDQDA